MKKFLKKSGKAACAAALAMCVWGGVSTADPALSINAGFKLPFTLVKFMGLEDGSQTKFLEVNDWPAYDGQDLKFNFHSDSAGIVINFKPFTEWAWDGLTTDADWSDDGSKKLKNDPAVGLNKFLDEYSAWFAFGRDKSWRIDMGNSEERHWYKGTDERVNNKPGEIGIIDCDDDSKVGVYYGLMGKTDGSASWSNHKFGNISYSQEYGFDSSVIGGNNHDNGQIIDSLRLSYSQGESGFFATAALLQQNGKQFSYHTDDKNQVDWVSGFGVRVGYAFDSIGSFEVIYKTLALGNNVFAAYYQPRFLDGALLGTIGVTGVFDVRDGSTKYGGIANEMSALGIDVRFQYNPTDKLKLFLYGNFSMVKPGDENTAGWAHYTDNKGKLVGNEAELGGYVVAAVGYQLPLGSLNLDVGYFMRDLDNNDGYDYGENYLAVKAGWNLWLGNGAGFGIGGAWYHYCNTGDLSKTANYTKDAVQIGAYLEVWLGN